ncbi:lysine 2,3-aminomutase YodO family protein [Methanolacinia petrolearia DSM 11571]|uniref:Lysine 2,3-aminomutase YodO family protein n=1 Tax=Methanolacinia petrolearia (strain DSM 11571 / OCM 486 / SEBR 4847) TaxID=679926 RepID=E1RK67_METP4|nr:KamA family radical SAM protein [Methanolacinia petrolearia]ADN35790.1 lysine 2,3-aminomutase YodO family protein [Methanolacinia petrolearia DSM 11571]
MTENACLTSIAEVNRQFDAGLSGLEAVENNFPFLANQYYLSLINWDDPEDPIKKIIIPNSAEMVKWGSLDPSMEARNTKSPGLQHKYQATALMLISDNCGGFCRFCFRKRLFIKPEDEKIRDLSTDIDYIRSHPEISNVLLSGGDALMIPTSRLSKIVSALFSIKHVKSVRIGTKMPAYNPFRITGDESLQAMIQENSRSGKMLYFMTQFNHPRELTKEAKEAMDLLRLSGASLANQTPILNGVNNDPETLSGLCSNLAEAGNVPYYLFQCRPAAGNRHFTVPVENTYEIYEKAKRSLSGLAKRARYVMSHATGKIEVIGMDSGKVYMKYHQAANPGDIGKMMSFKRNPKALWFDDYL